MARYYFNVRRGDTVYEDHDGVDLPNLERAIQHAMGDARSIMLYEPEIPPAGQWIDIVDHQRKALGRVPFVTGV